MRFMQLTQYEFSDVSRGDQIERKLVRKCYNCMAICEGKWRAFREMKILQIA